MGTRESVDTTFTMIRLTETGRTTQVLGFRVVDRDGNHLGTVADLLMDSGAGRFKLISVEHGGVAGFGATPSFIPVEAVSDAGRDHIRIGRSSAEVADAPLYDRSGPDSRDFFEDLYGYYGCALV